MRTEENGVEKLRRLVFAHMEAVLFTYAMSHM